MPDIWVIAGHVLIPLAFGLVPGLLPRRVPRLLRWLLWLALLASGGAYISWLHGGPDPYHWLGVASLSLSSLLSLYVLVVETSRTGRVRRG